MTATSLASLTAHPFLRGMHPGQIAPLARACRIVTIPPKHRFFDEGGAATQFWLIDAGRVALDIDVPSGRHLIVETLGPGDVLGLSWLSPPFLWQFGAQAVQQTTALELDAAMVRAACDQDPVVGYQLLRRLMSAASARLQAARIRMLDLYAVAGDRIGDS